MLGVLLPALATCCATNSVLHKFRVILKLEYMKVVLAVLLADSYSGNGLKCLFHFQTPVRSTL